MPVNPYFNHYSQTKTPEQELVESIISEAITIYGEDCYYIPRESWSGTGNDPIYGEDVASKFSKAFVIEMYHNNLDSFSGVGDFFSKFGMQLKDNINVTISGRGWRRSMDPDVRYVPREGDLIYSMTNQKLWEIKFVEKDRMFYTLGKKGSHPFIFELHCEAFVFSHEDIETGIEELDFLDTKFKYTMRLGLKTGSKDFHIGEKVIINGSISAEVSDWFYQNSFIDIINIQGDVSPNTVIVGTTSGASWVIDTVSDRDNFNLYDRTDAQDIQDLADQTLNTTEKDPFGRP